MAEKCRTQLLEVAILDRTGDRKGFSWEWQIRAGDKLIVCGYEATRSGASFAGNDALFLLLASGWNP